MRLHRLVLVPLAAGLVACAHAACPSAPLHTFADSMGHPVGHLLGEAIEAPTRAYTRLTIRSAPSCESPILYSIERTALRFADGTLDAPIADDGSRGFQLQSYGRDFVVTTCCAVRGGDNGAMDNIWIIWNGEHGRFELERTP